MICSSPEDQTSSSPPPLHGSSTGRTKCSWTHSHVHTCPACPGKQRNTRVTHLKVEVSQLRIEEWSQWAFNSNDQTQDQQFSNIFLIGAWRQTTLQRWHRWLTVSLQLHFYTLKLFGWRRPAESYQRQLWRHQRSFQKIPYWFVWGEGSLRMDLKQRIHIFCCLLMNLRTVTFFY